MLASIKLKCFKKIIATVFVTIFFAMPVYTEKSSAERDKYDDDMMPKITLVSNVQNWQNEKDINVELKIEWIGFLSTEAFEPAADLILESSVRGRYCAPIDVLTGDSLNGPSHRNPQKPSVIPISLNIKPNKLKWGVCAAGLWPNYPLFDTVPAGKYELYLEMEIESQDADGMPVWVAKRSNKLNISLKDKKSE